MTTAEFALEFDILYNNISSNKAPGLDGYEKSVFLTQAQEAIVISIYNGKLTGEGFEASEEMIRYIDHLIKEANNTTPTTGLGTSTSSVFYALPTDVWFPVYEQVIFDDNLLGCKNGLIGTVKEVTHDQLQSIRRNPFKGANDRRVLRLAIGANKVELITKYHIGGYFVRYLTKPDPIILETLGTGLTINGVASVTECKLDPIIHRLILSKAVQLAKAVWE